MPDVTSHHVPGPDVMIGEFQLIALAHIPCVEVAFGRMTPGNCPHAESSASFRHYNKLNIPQQAKLQLGSSAGVLRSLPRDIPLQLLDVLALLLDDGFDQVADREYSHHAAFFTTGKCRNRPSS